MRIAVSSEYLLLSLALVLPLACRSETKELSTSKPETELTDTAQPTVAEGAIIDPQILEGLQDLEGVSTLGFEGVIVPPTERAAPSDSKSRGWTPSREQIFELESKLPEYLWQEGAGSDILDNLGSFKRQYRGFYRDNRQLLGVFFLHQSTAVVQQGVWSKVPVGVAGGGSDYFRVWYDVGESEFTYFAINAPL